MQLLPKKWIDCLVSQPESGMNYQVVDITMEDGAVVPEVLILNCSYIGDRKEAWTKIDTSKIADIVVRIDDSED